MRLSYSILLTPIVAVVTGCLSTDPVKFDSKVRGWVPPGTPTADAMLIMKHHGFECYLITTNNPFNSTGQDYLDCEVEKARFHDWSARFILQDGKVSGYGPIKTN
jgi:hypothetical protein